MALNCARALAFFVVIVVAGKLFAAVFGLHEIVFGSFPLAETIAISAALGMAGAFMVAGRSWRLGLTIMSVMTFLLYGLVVFIQDQLGLLAVTNLGDPVVLQSACTSLGLFLGLEAMRRNRWWVLVATWG